MKRTKKLQTTIPGERLDPETRERLELRSKARVTNFIASAMKGRAVTGADAELHEACELDAGQIPLELWDVPQTENRDTENRATTVTPAPGTVGINLDPIRPAVFAPSVADKLQVDMPTVKSGTYATGTVSTSVTSDAVAKGADVPQTAGAITVGSTTPKRIGASNVLNKS